METDQKIQRPPFGPRRLDSNGLQQLGFEICGSTATEINALELATRQPNLYRLDLRVEYCMPLSSDPGQALGHRSPSLERLVVRQMSPGEMGIRS